MRGDARGRADGHRALTVAREDVRRSKFLALVLRHAPERIGLTLGDDGWIGVEQLLSALAAHGAAMARADLERIVRESDKQRFAFSEDGLYIRAQQGHSVAVKLDFPEAAPPAILFHGTVSRFLAAIRREGLTRRARHHVHLSAIREGAVAVGARRGKPVVLEVRAAGMAADGFVFYRSGNGVWLTERVPASYLVFPD
jgi:putative RNA 2'-phosphotransferase